LDITGLANLVEYLREEFSVPLELLDLRNRQHIMKDGVIVETKALPGDPKGYLNIDLGRKSRLAEIDEHYKKFYGANYKRQETMLFHNKKHHTYAVSRTALESDVIINLPKLKTHMKSGITISLKNMIGLIGEKNSIVHYRVGPPSKGGDEFPESDTAIHKALRSFNRRFTDLFLSRELGKYAYSRIVRFGGGQQKLGGARALSKESGVIHSGNWYGNDTVWRTVTDVIRISMYADKAGRIKDLPQRKMFIVVDGVIGGEGNGPLAPTMKHCGAIISGTNPWAVDRIGARLMGFSVEDIPLLSKNIKDLVPCDISVTLSENGAVSEVGLRDLPNLHFKLPRNHMKPR
jgi:hypothetical protein